MSAVLSRVPVARKFRGPDAHQISNAELAQMTKAALREAFADDKSAVKAIMAAANCNQRSADNWYRGRNAPGALYMLRLMAHPPHPGETGVPTDVPARAAGITPAIEGVVP